GGSRGVGHLPQATCGVSEPRRDGRPQAVVLQRLLWVDQPGALRRARQCDPVRRQPGRTICSSRRPWVVQVEGRRVLRAAAERGVRRREGAFMGVWGPGNFDNDTAFCYANDAVIKPMIALLDRLAENPSLADPSNNESFKIIAAAEVLAVLCEQLPLKVPAADLVEECRDLYLERWDEGIAKLRTAPGYREERRVVIAATFARLIEVCRRRKTP